MSTTGHSPVVREPCARVCARHRITVALLLALFAAGCGTTATETDDTQSSNSDSTAPADSDTFNDSADVLHSDLDPVGDTKTTDGQQNPDTEPPPNCDKDNDLSLAEECGGLDCDDNDATIHPNAIEICGNTVDENCSGKLNDRDADGDGHVDVACNGDDCRDDLAWVHPNAADYVSGYCVRPGQWEQVIPKTPGSHGLWPRLAFDANNRMHIIHHDTGQDQLLYIAKQGEGAEANWALETVSLPGSGGSNSSLLVDPDGYAHVSFLDYGLGALRYATNTEGLWVDVIVDASKLVGWFSSIGQDQSGRLHVAYRDSGSADLRYATCGQSCADPQGPLEGWNTTVVDHEGDVGKFSSLVVYPDGRLAIAYQDITNQRLRVAKAPSHSGPWTLETVETLAGTGWSIDLQRGLEDSLNVSYVNQQQDRLMFASNGSGSWETQDCAPAGLNSFTGQRTSLIIDSIGLPHIAFTDDLGLPLKYAGCRERCGALCCPDQWQTVTINPTEGAGALLSMTVDRHGMLSIVHRQGQEEHLFVSQTTCIESPLDSNCDGIDGEDHDNDGFASHQTGGLDCDDNNIKINPSVDDVPDDGIDANCDGTDCGDNCVFPCETDCDCAQLDVSFPAPCDKTCDQCGNHWQCEAAMCVPHCGEIPPEIQACSAYCEPIACKGDGYVPVDTNQDGCKDLCVFNTGCGGKCGQSLPYGLCQCTADCVENGTCCEDFCEMCMDSFPEACCIPQCDGKAPGDSDDCGGTCDGPPMSGSCWKKCGEFDGTQPCQCNPECMDDFTCCDDFCAVCAINFPEACCKQDCTGKPEGAPNGCGGLCPGPGDFTCQDKCGLSNATWPCQCDATCSTTGSCCPDFCAVCSDELPGTCCIPQCANQPPGAPDGCGDICPPTGGPSDSCQDNCGVNNPAAACQCHAECIAEGTCCADFCLACPTTGGPDCCVPDCVNKPIGEADGCGGTCVQCLPQCASLPPGAPDGCGGVCEPCDPAQNPMCCIPDCVGKNAGEPDGCGAVCSPSGPVDPPSNVGFEMTGSCAGMCGQSDTSLPCQCDESCFSSNTCCIDICTECSPQFQTECGQTCFCPYPQIWHNDTCCTPSCDGLSCGQDNGCGGACACESTHLCDNGLCVETPTTCSPIQAISCGETLTGQSNNAGGATQALETYSCGSTMSIGYSNGNELVYTFQTDVEQVVHISSTDDQWLDLFILEDQGTGCDGATQHCIQHGNYQGQFKSQPNQNYFIVWDTWTTNRVEDFSITVDCCTPDCTDKMCGDDGCGEPCGQCESGATCINNNCCQPQCNGVQCGNDDGCGSKCACTMGKSCQSGTCAAAPTTCTPMQAVSCGDVITQQANVMAGTTFAFDNYSCSNTTSDTVFGLSNELVYSFTATEATAVHLDAKNNHSMHVMVLRDTGLGCVDDGSNCIAQDPNVASFDAKAGETYYIVWDGTSDTVVQDFTMEVECCKKNCTPGLCGKPNGCGGVCECSGDTVCHEGTCCQPQCVGADCDNGCGGYCGAGPACGDIGPQGACADGHLMRCDNGVLIQINCGKLNKNCGYDTFMKKYLCL